MKEKDYLCILCDSEIKAKRLFQIFIEKDYEWCTGRRLNVDETKWEEYGPRTCYYIDRRELSIGTIETCGYETTKITADVYIRNNGYDDFISIWNFLKGIILPLEEGGLSTYIKESLFGTTDYREIIEISSDDEIEEKFEEYKSKYFLIPGDIIELSGGKTRGIVLDFKQSKCKILWRNMNTADLLDDEEFTKVGHVDISDLIKALDD